jgi:hypothetical protein
MKADKARGLLRLIEGHVIGVSQAEEVPLTPTISLLYSRLQHVPIVLIGQKV